MNDCKLPFYDVITHLFIGGAFVIIIYLLTPIEGQLTNLGIVSHGSALVILSYTAGQCIHGIGRILINTIPRYRNSNLKRQVWSQSISEEERKAFEYAIVSYYRFKKIPDRNLEGLCISPIDQRTSKRDTFVAVANYNRSMATLIFLLMLGFVGYAIILRTHAWKVAIVVGPALLLCYIFLESYAAFVKYSSIVAYTSFLSWWSEKIFNAALLREVDGGNHEL